MNGPAGSCPKCGASVEPDDRFCESCGFDLPPGPTPSGVTGGSADADPPARCVRCGGSVDADRYCLDCGLLQPAPHDHVEVDLGAAGAGVTDRGRHHHRNEDSLGMAVTAGRMAVVVCDGVSSTPDADRAAQTAVDAALSALARVGDDSAADHRRAATAAAEAVAALSSSAAQAPSCTYVAVTVEDPQVTVAWVGDSRAYLLDVSGVRRLTRDDSWAQDMVDRGLADEAGAMADPRAHQITRWLGADARPQPEARTATVAASLPATVVVCSDGLWNYLADDAALAGLIAPGATPIDVARHLVDFANQAGGHDNITAAIIVLSGPGSAPAAKE